MIVIFKKKNISDAQKKKANSGHQKRAGLLSSALQSMQKRFGKDTVGTPEVGQSSCF